VKPFLAAAANRRSGRRSTAFRVLEKGWKALRADKFLDELVWMAKTLRYGRDNIALDS